MEHSTGPVVDAREPLERQAKRDDPARILASADMSALAAFESNGSQAEQTATRRTDVEALIPGLEARPTVMIMGWAIFTVVLVATAVSHLSTNTWIDTVTHQTSLAVGSIAVVAAIWSLLSEIRGWEGSNAARWHAKGRIKAYRRARDRRHREIGDTLIAVGADTIRIYRIADGAVVCQDYPLGLIEELTIERTDNHLCLHLKTPTGSWRFDRLPRDAAFEEAVGRFRRAKTSGPRRQVA